MVSNLAKLYYNINYELYESNGLLFKKNCVVVRKRLRKEMLNKLHFSDMGVEKTKSWARDILYWPGMNNDIENLISNCSVCKNNSKESLHPHDIPNQPWEKIGTDIFHYKGNNYIIVVDYFSKYVEISLLPSLTMDNVCM